jgi:hypothetical protein
MDELPGSNQPPTEEHGSDTPRQGSRALVIWAVVLGVVPVLVYAAFFCDLVPAGWPPFVVDALPMSALLWPVAALLAILAFRRGDPAQRPALAFAALMVAMAPLVLQAASIAVSPVSDTLASFSSGVLIYAAVIGEPVAAVMAITSLARRRGGRGWAVATLAIFGVFLALAVSMLVVVARRR